MSTGILPAGKHDKDTRNFGGCEHRTEPPQARAIAESLEIAFRDQEDDLTKRLMTKQDGVELKAEIRAEMHGFKAEIIKWMFLFWIGQTVATAAIVKLLVP